MTEQITNKKNWYCPDASCKQYKIYMTIDDNWKHLIEKHKANKRPPKFKNK